MLSQWIKSLKIISWLKSALVFINNQFYHWFSPIPRYEQELTTLLTPRAEAFSLYKQFIEGDAQQKQCALSTLTKAALDKKSPKGVWASKILSYIYSKGFDDQYISILPQKVLADQYVQQSAQSIQTFENRLRKIVTKLNTVWFFKKKALALVEWITTKDKESGITNAKVKGQAQTSYSGIMANNNSPILKKPMHVLNTTFSAHVPPPLDKNKRNTETKLQQAMIWFNEDMFNEDIKKISLIEEIFKEVTAKKNNNTLSQAQLALYEQLSLKLAKYYEKLFLKTPSSYNFNLDAEAKSYLENALFYFRQISSCHENYAIIQFKIVHYYKYFLSDSAQEKVALEALCDIGDSDSAYKLVMNDFNKFWYHYVNQKLSAEEKEIVRNYESDPNHRSFLDQVKISPRQDFGSLQLTALAILKKLVAELKDFSHNLPASSSLRSDVEELMASVISFEKTPAYSPTMGADIKNALNLMRTFNPQMKQNLEAFWASKVSEFSVTKPEDLVATSKVSLAGYLNFIEVIKNHSGVNANDYFKIFKQAYFELLAKVCKETMSKEMENSGLTEVNQSLNERGVDIHA
ncbi:MAG: hypothetical protein H0U71_05590 [Gammaproteobacteria bacterium]|nr:hypothetical protein [Gammaproteobacteria bacterium]